MRAYIVVVGKIALKGFLGKREQFATIGYLEAGDTLGEEGIFEVNGAIRKDTAPQLRPKKRARCTQYVASAQTQELLTRYMKAQLEAGRQVGPVSLGSR